MQENPLIVTVGHHRYRLCQKVKHLDPAAVQEQTLEVGGRSRVAQKGATKIISNGFFFSSLAKLHLVLTCLWHLPPTLTPSKSIPGFISSHSAAIMEHLSCQRRGHSLHTPLLPFFGTHTTGRLVFAATQLSPELPSSQELSCFLLPQAQGSPCSAEPSTARWHFSISVVKCCLGRFPSPSFPKIVVKS